MLPEHERRTLRQIEDKLLATDPRLAEAMRSADRGRPPRWRSILICADITITITLLVGVLADSNRTVLLGILGLAVVGGTHLARRPRETFRTTPGSS